MPLKHLISFYSTREPTFSCWGSGEEEEIELKGNIYVEFSGVKCCTGFRGREKRQPCPHRYEGKEQCPLCSALDISRIYTRGDFTGFEDLEEKFQDHEFS
ncbi:MAG: hypothetical protein QXH30_03345, partial [Candidatus Bilamarchaeaceae archaeon]